jgi:hypothetical protein
MRRPGRADAVLDARARAQYRERLRDLETELEEASACNDLARARPARAEMDLVSAAGAGPRARWPRARPRIAAGAGADQRHQADQRRNVVPGFFTPLLS